MGSFLLANRYELGDEIGRGGIGIVYRARDRLLNRTVAVKMLNPELAENQTFREHLWKEARAAASLSHPNIISIYDLVEEAGQYYLVMEYFPGESLRALLQRESPLPYQRAAYLLSQVGQALAAAHQEGVIHRDIKPRNILVNEHNQVKVADFGLAASRHQPPDKAERLMGSLPYLAPEVIRGKESCPQTDIYSAGIVLYEALTGRVPFPGSSPEEVLEKHLHEEPVPVNRLKPGVPPALAEVVAHALAKDPGGRYPDARAFTAALKPFCTVEEDVTRVLQATPEKGRLRLPLVVSGVFLLCLALLAALFYSPLGVSLPRLQGMELEAAYRRLGRLELRAYPWRQVYSDGVGAGQVAGQWPQPGRRWLKGLPVLLTVSLGSRFVTVPDVRGKPVAQAVQELKEAGLKVTGEPHPGIVQDTTPAPSTRQPRGSVVALRVQEPGTPEQGVGISVRLAQPSQVRLEVQDAAGRRIAYQQQLGAGSYRIPVTTYGKGTVFLYIDQRLVQTIPIT